MLRKRRANLENVIKIKNKKNEKIPCFSAALCYSLSMKDKAPQKGQLWAIGTKVYRIVEVKGDTVRAHHHGQMSMFYTRHLKPVSKSQVEEYL